MPTPTYDLIDSQVLSTSAASVSFTAIPATYRDLVLVVEAKASGTGAGVLPILRFNSDSGANYSRIHMAGDGSTATSDAGSGDTGFYLANGSLSMSSTDPMTMISSIMDYSATDKHKSILTRSGRTGLAVHARAGRWASTSAITSLEVLLTSTFTYSAGSTFYLYGIAS